MDRHNGSVELLRRVTEWRARQLRGGRQSTEKPLSDIIAKSVNAQVNKKGSLVTVRRLMNIAFILWLFAGACSCDARAASARQPAALAYAGFDRNDYPGDAALPVLRKSFRYTGYWLNIPPGDTQNTWSGRRGILKEQGFGFMVLFNGRLDAALQGHGIALLGRLDGEQAVSLARKEGFPPDVLIFLDQEEGGRLLPEQSAYLFGWVDAVRKAGARAGIYCSGIQVADGNSTISTAQDIMAKESARNTHQKLSLWIANDECPPSPGCSAGHSERNVILASNLPGAVVWQFAMTPRRAEFTAGCPTNYDADGSCYAPGLAHSPASFVDLDAANSPDPSGGR
jgi:hypothetical protein